MKRVMVVVVVLALVAGGVGLVVAGLAIRGRAAARWAAVLERQRTALARLGEGDGSRPPLAGVARPGNAWDDYTAAFATLETEPDRPTPVTRMALQRVRDGAVRARAWYGFDPAASQEPTYRGAIRAATMLGALARERREAGDAEGALDAVADGLQVAADVGRIPRHAPLMAAVGPMADPSLDALRDVVVDSRTSSATLARARQLALDADRQLPSSARAFTGESVVFVEGCRRFLADPTAPRPSRWALRRFSFSWRLHLAFLADNWAAIAENAGWRETSDWASLAAPGAAPAGSDPDFVTQSTVPMAVPSWQAAERRVREARARLRLVAAAASERLGRGPGSPDWPADPFTLQPIHRRADGAVVLWSTWTDGDQGGKGSWRPEATGTPQDIVLELQP